MLSTEHATRANFSTGGDAAADPVGHTDGGLRTAGRVGALPPRSATGSGPDDRRAVSPRELRSAAPASVVPSMLWFNPAWLSMLAAVGLGWMGVAAIGTTDPSGESPFALRQGIFLAFGVFVAAMAAVPHPKFWRRASLPLGLLSIALLIFVLLPFVPHSIVRPRNGARRWISLVVMDFQPSELAKIAFVLMLATYLQFRQNYRRFLGLLAPFLIMFVPMGLILVEPDLGTSLIFPAVLFAMLVAAGAKLLHLMSIAAVGAVSASIVVVVCLAAAAQQPPQYPILEEHQVKRIQGVLNLNDARYEDSINYQSTKAMMLVGAGGVDGVGEENSRVLLQFNRLPEDHNDMIFAVVVNRWGFLGGLTLLALYLTYVVGLVLVAATNLNPFGRLVCVGFCAILLAQVMVNVGMTIGLLPITGMTLPFVSYGGSSLVSLFFMTGIALGIGLRPPEFLARPSFEFDPKREPPHRVERLTSLRGR